MFLLIIGIVSFVKVENIFWLLLVFGVGLDFMILFGMMCFVMMFVNMIVLLR